MIAATAELHGADFLTQNVKHFPCTQTLSPPSPRFDTLRSFAGRPPPIQTRTRRQSAAQPMVTRTWWMEPSLTKSIPESAGSIFPSRVKPTTPLLTSLGLLTWI